MEKKEIFSKTTADAHLDYRVSECKDKDHTSPTNTTHCETFLTASQNPLSQKGLWRASPAYAGLFLFFQPPNAQGYSESASAIPVASALNIVITL